MKFGQILVCCMTNISNMFLAQYWRLEISAGNNILNPGGHHDQIIPLFSSHFKFPVVSWYMPKNPVGHHHWETENFAI